MKRAATFFLFLLPVLAQVKPPEPPIAVDLVTMILGDPDLKDEILNLSMQVQQRGISFDLDDQLSAILDAAAKGKGDPKQIAALISVCLRACQACRARDLAPLTAEDLRVLLTQWHFTPNAILREVQTRGVKDLPNNEAQANQLRAWGASEDLIALALPDDKLPAISPGDDYKRLDLKHAEEYDPSAPKGWLKVSGDLPPNSQNEFVFVHTGLFVKALKGEGPAEVDASFNKPGPRNVPEDHVEYGDSKLEGLESPIDEKHSGTILGLGKGKSKPVAPSKSLVLNYSVPDADGRNQFVFTLANNGTTPQHFVFTLRWQVLATPKEVKPPAPPEPSKKK